MTDFPLHAHDEWTGGDGFHLTGDAYLTQQGQLRAEISTWTASWVLGFTGGANVLVADSGGNILHRWQIWPLGVDALAVWWKPSRRTDYPEDQIDPVLAAKATSLTLTVGHFPKPRWDEILKDPAFQTVSGLIPALIDLIID
ncbi:hypothetical protein [Streptomyces sp. NPDC001652]|uniref:hypothetical protein n=1 Tax=Streptomyces sp. NPDC001652 TaxID=3154393 RepID=UPI00331FF661